MTERRTDGTSAFNTRTERRRLLLLDPAMEEEEVSGEGEGGARGWGPSPMHLPTIYRGGGGWFLSLQVHWGVGKGGRKENPSFPFPTDCYPPFLGILILSLRDMILFLLRGILVCLEQG